MLLKILNLLLKISTENMCKCFFCGCSVPESEPKFTFYFSLNDQNTISHSALSNYSFPLAYIQITHEKNEDGSFEKDLRVVNLCSRNCFFPMESRREKIDERCGKRKKIC